MAHRHLAAVLISVLITVAAPATAGPFRAGTASGPAARALALSDGAGTVVLVAADLRGSPAGFRSVVPGHRPGLRNVTVHLLDAEGGGAPEARPVAVEDLIRIVAAAVRGLRPARAGWSGTDASTTLRVVGSGGEALAALEIPAAPGRPRLLVPGGDCDRAGPAAAAGGELTIRSVRFDLPRSIFRDLVPRASVASRIDIAGRSLFLTPGRPTAAFAAALEEEAARRGVPGRVVGVAEDAIGTLVAPDEWRRAVPAAQRSRYGPGLLEAHRRALFDDLLAEAERRYRREVSPGRLRVAEEGSFDEVDGVPRLWLRGTPYEMGFQHGTWLRARIRDRLRAIRFELARSDVARTTRDPEPVLERSAVGRAAIRARRRLVRVPLDRLAEMRGIADGAGISVDEAVLLSFPRTATGAASGESIHIVGEPARGGVFLAVTRPGCVGVDRAVTGRSIDLSVRETGPGADLAAILVRHAASNAASRRQAAEILAPAVEAGATVGITRGDPGVDAASLFPGIDPVLRLDRDRSLLEGCRVLSVVFASPEPSGDVRNDTVPAELHEPTACRPRGAIVLLPIWAGPGLALERHVAAQFARRGWTTLVIPLPHQHGREPPGTRSGRWTVSDDLERNGRVFRQAAAEVRAARGWLIDRGYRADRVALMGISLGGHIAAYAHASDPIFARGVFVLTGADFASLLWNDSRETRGIKRRLRARGLDLPRLRELCAPIEPLRHARPWRGEGALLVGATRDRVVPPPNVLALRTALGQPPILWVDASHVSGAFSLPRIVDWLATRLDRP